MQSVQNLGLALITLLCGIIVDNGGYLMLEIFFLACLCGKCSPNAIRFCLSWFIVNNEFFGMLFFFFAVALVTTVVIYLYDSSHGGILNMSAVEREVYEKNRM